MTGLVGWWPLHEDSGSKAYDLSGNGNHGSLNGGIVQGVAGKGGLTSYSFDGSDDSVKAGGADLDTTSPPWTFTAWIKRNGDFGNEQKFFGQAPADETYQEGQFSLQFSHSGQPEENKFYIGVGGGSTEVIGNTAIEDRKWHHVALSYDGSQWKVYLDGNLDGSTTSVPSPSNVSANPLWLGGVYNNWSSVNMANVRFYSRQLTSEEIRTLYDWGNGDYARPLDRSSSSAVSRWALDGDVTDSWSGNDGTTTGGLSFTDNAVRGQAANFDGSDDYVEVSDLSSLGGSGSFSFSFWMDEEGGESHNYPRFIWKNNYPGDTNADGLIDFYYHGGGGYYHAVTGDGSSQYVAEWTTSRKLSGWHHWTVVIDTDNETLSIYNNGVEVAQSTGPQSTATNGGSFYIGTGENSRFASANIDDVRIYDKALSPQEIFELYRYGTRGRDLRKFTVNSRGL